jgi:hypothetical protein
VRAALVVGSAVRSAADGVVTFADALDDLVQFRNAVEACQHRVSQVMLETISEGAICVNLKNRYMQDSIYVRAICSLNDRAESTDCLHQTNIGPVLIAINPFKMIAPLYTDARIRYGLVAGVSSLSSLNLSSLVQRVPRQEVL